MCRAIANRRLGTCLVSAWAWAFPRTGTLKRTDPGTSGACYLFGRLTQSAGLVHLPRQAFAKGSLRCGQPYAGGVCGAVVAECHRLGRRSFRCRCRGHDNPAVEGIGRLGQMPVQSYPGEARPLGVIPTVTILPALKALASPGEPTMRSGCCSAAFIRLRAG